MIYFVDSYMYEMGQLPNSCVLWELLIEDGVEEHSRIDPFVYGLSYIYRDSWGCQYKLVRKTKKKPLGYICKCDVTRYASDIRKRVQERKDQGLGELDLKEIRLIRLIRN